MLFFVGHRVMVAHDLQADDEKVQKKVAKKSARQQVLQILHTTLIYFEILVH